MAQKKILIVEDDIAINKVLCDKFKIEGFTVFSAKNGKDGLEIAIREEPDMTLLDIMMPVMDGLTMLDLLRSTAWGKDANVILLTNLNEADKMSTALSESATAYLVKADWKIDDLVSEVKKRM